MAVNNLSMQRVRTIGRKLLGLHASLLAADFPRRITTAAFQEARTDKWYRLWLKMFSKASITDRHFISYMKSDHMDKEKLRRSVEGVESEYEDLHVDWRYFWLMHRVIGSHPIAKPRHLLGLGGRDSPVVSERGGDTARSQSVTTAEKVAQQPPNNQHKDTDQEWQQTIEVDQPGPFQWKMRKTPYNRLNARLKIAIWPTYK